MSEIQTVSAAIHEIAHAKLHDMQVIKESGENPKDRRTEEVEAESISFAVCQYYGIETGANSFGYIAEWSRGRELKELNASLDTIRKAVAGLIDGIDAQYRALAKERGTDLSASVITKAQDEPAPIAPPAEPAATSPELSANQIYAQYANIIAERAAQYAVSSATLLQTDEAEAHRSCDQIVNRVVNDLLLEPGGGEHYPLYKQYMDNTDFKGRLEDYVFIRAYLEPKNAMREAAPVHEAPQEAAAPDRAGIPDYSAFIYNGLPISNTNPAVGTTVLLPPVFHRRQLQPRREENPCDSRRTGGQVPAVQPG
jgi:hypothetical protein